MTMAAAALEQEQLHQAGVDGAAAASVSPPPPAAVRVLDTALVRPYSSAAGGPAPPEETSLPLTFLDVMWLYTPPVQCLYFYRLAPDADVDAILANLKASMSHAVRAFYPLAGHVRLIPGQLDTAAANRYELHYRPGDAVAFTVAEYDGDFAAGEPRDVAKIAPLAPPLPAGGALLALQATLLSGRRGLVLGITVHHAACDGTNATDFLHTWAAAAAGGGRTPPPPPVIDRTLISDPGGRLYDLFFPVKRIPERADDGLLFATFILSKDQLQRVKDVVAAEASARGVAPPPRCSTMVATLALAWSSYHRAGLRGGGGGAGNGGDRTCLLLPVDHRSRLNPPLPDKYFGNCIGAAFAVASRSELAAEAGAGGLLAACAAIAAAIDDAVSGVATETMGKRKARIMEVFATMDVLMVAGSARFRVYDLDMGFGRPEMADLVSVAKTNAIALNESPTGDGGMEAGVCLPPEGIDAFRKSFADAVAALEPSESSIANGAQ